MASAGTALDRLLDPFSECFNAESAQRIAHFNISPTVEARMDTLAESANDGKLSAEERSEYEALINTTDLISIIKLKTAKHISTGNR